MSSLTKEQLLARQLSEIEDVIRTMPSPVTILHHSPENDAWFGRACAAIESWDKSKGVLLGLFLAQITSPSRNLPNEGLRQFRMLLHQACHDLLLQTPGSGNVAVPHGMVFDYFDELRKIIELANQDLLFVDPYLDADFVSRYLPHVAAGVAIRLLAREKLGRLR